MVVRAGKFRRHDLLLWDDVSVMYFLDSEKNCAHIGIGTLSVSSNPTSVNTNSETTTKVPSAGSLACMCFCRFSVESRSVPSLIQEGQRC